MLVCSPMEANVADRQFLAYMRLYFRFGHSIDEFYFYQLCSPEWRRYAELFLPWDE